MSLQVEKLEKNMVKFTVETTAEDFNAAIDKAYAKNKGRFNIQGFRKGKAPRFMIEKLYGPDVFFEEAANIVLPDAYEKAAEESGLTLVSRPEINVTQIEKDKPFIFTAEVAVKPEVTLGEYKGIAVEAPSSEVTAEEVDAEIDKVRDQNARKIRLMTNNPVKRTGLEGYGLEIIETIPIIIEANKYNEKYLKTKKERMGHSLKMEDNK